MATQKQIPVCVCVRLSTVSLPSLNWMYRYIYTLQREAIHFVFLKERREREKSEIKGLVGTCNGLGEPPSRPGRAAFNEEKIRIFVQPPRHLFSFESFLLLVLLVLFKVLSTAKQIQPPTLLLSFFPSSSSSLCRPLHSDGLFKLSYLLTENALFLHSPLARRGGWGVSLAFQTSVANAALT